MMAGGIGIDRRDPVDRGGEAMVDPRRQRMRLDRLAMLKYGMPDARDMFAGDTRWLEHYGFSAFQAPSSAAGLS